MRTSTYHSHDLLKLLRRNKIATLADLKGALATSSDSTVFRKLKELSYRTSYSHRGSYYTLDETTRFDDLGLWSFRDVWFSRHGTLVSTVRALVQAAEAGYYATELDEALHVAVKVPLLRLVREHRISRQKIAGRYLYCASDSASRKSQVAARRVSMAQPRSLGSGLAVRVLPNELKAAIILFFSLLDEKQRRLYAGLESLKLGHGGDRQIADLLNMDVGTIARGRRQLLQHDVEVERARRQGGGRKHIEKKRRR